MTVKRIIKRSLHVVLYAAAFIVPTLAVGLMNMGSAQRALTASARPFTAAELAPPSHDPAKPTVAVLASNAGTEISDFLAPYEVFAATEAFNVYAVAPEREFTPFMWGGVDIMPHYSFAELDALLGHDPDVIVVPFIQDRKNPQIIEWIRRHAGPETLVVSICGGAYVLAATGLVDDGKVTTHNNVFALIAKEYPQIELVRGVRYTDNGNTITSAGITAGIDASLYAVKKLLGADAALAVARKLNYPHARFLEDPAYPLPDPGADKYTMALNFGYRTGQPTIGVYLPEGVDEIDLTAMLDSYGRTFTAFTSTFAAERQIVRSRHGLYLVPRYSFASLPIVARMLSPIRQPSAVATQADAWARSTRSMDIEQLFAAGRAGANAYAFDVMLADVARHENPADARAAAWSLEFPTDHLALPAGRWPAERLLPPLGIGLLGAAGLALALRGGRALLAVLRRRPAQQLTVAP